MIGGALSVMYGRLSMEALRAALEGPYQVPISLAPVSVQIFKMPINFIGRVNHYCLFYVTFGTPKKKDMNLFQVRQRKKP